MGSAGQSKAGDGGQLKMVGLGGGDGMHFLTGNLSGVLCARLRQRA